MHKLARRLIPVVLLPVAMAFSSASSAGSFTGYAVQVLNGCCGGTSYDGTLVGMSSTPTGTVQQYLFTSDRTYAEMAVDAKLHTKQILVNTCSAGGGVCGMNFQ